MHTDYKMPELIGDSPALIAFILLQEHLDAISEEDSKKIKADADALALLYYEFASRTKT